MKKIWMLFSVLVAGTLAGDQYHPHIVKSQVVFLDVKSIEANAQRGATSVLPLGESEVKIALAPAPVWPKEGLSVLEFGDDGSSKESLVDGNITYAGEVVDEDPAEGEVRFTIAHGEVDGYVLTSTGWWFIEPLSRFDAKAGAGEHLVYATHDLDFELEFRDEVKLDDVKFDRVTAPRPPRKDPRIGMTMVADESYRCLSGDGMNYHERHATLLNQINGFYLRETGREFKLVRSVALEAGGGVTSTTNSTKLINQFSSYAGAKGLLNEPEEDMAQMTTARYMDDDVLGVADPHGVTSVVHQGVVRVGGSLQQQIAARMLSYQNMMVAAHEIGHNFDGEHYQADKWCVWDTFLGCLDYERTIMWSAFYPDNNARFSDGTRNPAHNNKQAVIDDMNATFPLP